MIREVVVGDAEFCGLPFEEVGAVGGEGVEESEGVAEKPVRVGRLVLESAWGCNCLRVRPKGRLISLSRIGNWLGVFKDL